MSEQWRYWSLPVVWDTCKNSTGRQPVKDWQVKFNDNTRWEGWNEILSQLGEKGWEVFSVVPVAAPAGTAGFGGGTEHFRLFAKKPKT